MIPGIPCRLLTPHVSLIPSFYLSDSDNFIYPKAETIPDIEPMMIAMNGLFRMSALEPIPTPPANVAFRTTSISSL